MSHLLRLYPRTWRERDGEEVLALLEDRSPGPRAKLDLVRGALDARLHPPARCRPLGPDGRPPLPRRSLHPAVLVLMAIAGLAAGYALLAGIVSVVYADPDRWGGWCPSGFTLAAGLLLAGLVISLRRPTLGALLGLAGGALAVAAEPRLWPAAVGVGVAATLPLLARIRRGARRAGPTR